MEKNEQSGSPVLFGDVCRADAMELRDISRYFDDRGLTDNGEFLRKVADKLEVLAGAYSTAAARAQHLAMSNAELEKWKRENL